jgi:hypothetical protein
MMEDKDIEKFTKDIFIEIGLEKPSSSFVNNVMNRVEAPVKSMNVIYKPLITKKMWGFIATCFFGIIVWMLVTTPNESSFLNKLNLNLITNIDFNFFKGVSFSSPIIYGLSVFGLLVLVQIYLLKNNFDKQIGAL